jgi:hypothetical protein
MRWYTKRRTINLGKFVAPKSLPPVSLEELIEEALLIARAGVRLSVKNLMILKSMRDHADWDVSRYVEAVRQELSNLADEKDGDAARIAALADAARKLSGEATHHSDYRSGDVEPLNLRERVSHGLAARLRELSMDDEYVAEFVELAHTSAWEEIAASVEAKLVLAAQPPDDDYEKFRDERLFELLGDLAELDATT